MSAWLDRARCRNRPDLDGYFFAEAGQESKLETAKLICSACFVRKACLQFALDSGQDHGVWGGKTARERRVQRAQRLLRRVS